MRSSIFSFHKPYKLINFRLSQSGALCESFNTSLETQLEKEKKAIYFCAKHPDGQEGVQAFYEKRKPIFNEHSQKTTGQDEISDYSVIRSR